MLAELITDVDATVVKAKKSAAILFWAEWSGGCHVYRPTFDQVASESSGLYFYTFEASSDSTTAGKYSVSALPTVVLFSQGECKARLVGAVTKTRLSEFVAAV